MVLVVLAARGYLLVAIAVACGRVAIVVAGVAIAWVGIAVVAVVLGRGESNKGHHDSENLDL